MKISTLIAVLLLFASINAQEIPDGVRYKKAPDAINNATKANLENAAYIGSASEKCLW